MSFLAFRNSRPNSHPRQSLFRAGGNSAGTLRQRLRDERDFASVGAPLLVDPALALLRESYPSGVCLINRPLCGLTEPALGGWANRYGNIVETFEPGDRDRAYGRGWGCVGNNNGSGSACGYNYYGRGGAGGWQQIGYLLPLHVEPRRVTHGGGRRCTCARGQVQTPAPRRSLRQPSRFQSNAFAEEPFDSYNNVHEAGCPFAVEENDCQSRQCGVRRYHLYVRIDPDRLGQQCLYTSARRGDHRYNNCRYLQFGVSEEGLHDSAIMILTRDFIIDGSSQRLVSTGASRCIEDGDVMFVPGERNRKFRVTLYDDRIYDGNC